MKNNLDGITKMFEEQKKKYEELEKRMTELENIFKNYIVNNCTVKRPVRRESYD